MYSETFIARSALWEFISESCMCISCVCGLHQQDGNKAGRKISLLVIIIIALLQCLVWLDTTKSVHHLFSKSMDMIFTSTARINYFLEEHTNAQ